MVILFFGIYGFIADSMYQSQAKYYSIIYLTSYLYRDTMTTLVIHSVYLAFAPNQNLYYFWCKYCDNGCRSCCIKVAKRNIQKARRDTYLLLTD